MPDTITILQKRWKLIAFLTLVATIIAIVISLLLPKQYLSTVTALPANSLTADKGRIFNNNIESLYPEIGTVDELDRIEGTAQLDTLFIAVAETVDLIAHYAIDKNAADGIYQSALALKKNTDIRRSAYGELKIKVWDVDAELAAQLANRLFSKLNEIHQHIQSVNNNTVLEKLHKALIEKQIGFDSLSKDLVSFVATHSDSLKKNSTIGFKSSYNNLPDEIKQYQKIIAEYELSLKTNPNVLIPVEYARASPWPDKPRVAQNALFAFGASLVFSILLAVLAESRKSNVRN